jgi:tetratricopeptide (TPR) repeat protein
LRCSGPKRAPPRNLRPSSGLPAEEAAQLRRILTERLADPESSLPAGVLRYLIGNPDADEDELRLLLAAANARVKDNDIEMLSAIAFLQFRLELFEDARETYEHLRELAPSQMLNWECVLLDIELERWADAAAGLKPIVAKQGASLTARLMYIDALSRLGERDEMLRQIDLLSSDNPLMTELINDTLADSAWNLYDAGKDLEAEAVFRRILASDPKNSQALAAVLNLYGTEEELEAHRAALESARDEETDPHVLLEQGGNLLAAGDAEQALELLERASRSLPDEEIAWFNLGLAALKLERWDTAEQALLHATRINPGRADSFFNRGSALQKLGRCAEAIEALNRTLELAPDKTEAYYYLYACHVELGNDEAAQEALRLYNAR